jgi:hypothetical protein
MALMQAVDPSGVALAGPDRNAFAGNGSSRALLLDEAWVPAGKQWTLTSEGGAVVLAAPGPSGFYPYDGAGVNVSGSLTVRPGTAWGARSRSVVMLHVRIRG